MISAKRRFLWVTFFGGLILIFFTSCKIKKYERDPTKKLNIVTTTGIIADAVKNIVKDSADVHALMGPGVDPHLYKASFGDLEKLTRADIIFYNGLHLEGKMGEVLKKLSRVKPVVAVSEKINKSLLTKTGEDYYDPHIWFDVKLWQKTVIQMDEALSIYDSLNKGFYHRNALEYLSKLDDLDKYIRKKINEIPEQQRVLITAHDAFGYFGEAYKIEVRGLQGISTLSEFGLHDVTDLVDFISERKIKAVFVETSVSEKAINAVVQGSRKSGHEVKIGGSLYSDALGEKGTPEGTYIGMVTKNVNTITKALK